MATAVSVAIHQSINDFQFRYDTIDFSHLALTINFISESQLVIGKYGGQCKAEIKP